MPGAISRVDAARWALEALVVCAFAAILVVGVAGPADIAIPGMVLRLRGIGRLAAIAAAALLLRVALGLRRTSRHEWLSETAATVFRVTVLTILVSDLGLVLGHLVMACGGLDSAGYLGSARLFLSGRLTAYQPVARVLPFVNATTAVAPLGFVASATPYFIAPRFPPGLPLVMATGTLLGGRAAPFFVAPALGIGLVTLTYVMTRRMAGSTTAALGAVMVATDPVFIHMTLQPMSDVPATFWVVLAGFLLWRPAPRPVFGGLAAGLAILTRPPLVLAAVAIALMTKWSDRRRPLLFACVTGVFVVALMALQSHIYGHALTSGYGSAGQLFTLSALRTQLALYGKWLLVVHTPLLVLLFAAGARANPRLAWRAGAVFMATAAPYLVYAPRFEDWEILRFLLPTLPFVFISCASGVVWLANGINHPLRAHIVATVVAIAIAAGSYAFLLDHSTFDLHVSEMKYPLVGEWFARNTPQNAVAISALHSGSLRFYSDRATLRMEALPEGALLETVNALQRAAYVPYVVLEQGDEYEEFEHRFHPDAIGSLTITPEARIRGVQVLRLATR